MERKVTRVELSQATGIPVRSLAAYERGVAVPLGRAVLIAAALGIPVQALVDGAPYPTATT